MKRIAAFFVHLSIGTRLCGSQPESFVRGAVMSYWHETCTVKMSRDAMSVVDGDLRVYGIDNRRIADGSIMPPVTPANGAGELLTECL
jgi:choline dehydrogenase